MSHSKRNTSLAFFTSHERSLLKSTWGSQATRLSRDSFLPFASCQLCLQIARDPVACSSNGDMFCRECAVSNLLAQRQEIKRLEKDDERRRREDEEQEREKVEEERGKAVEDFEKVTMGLEGKPRKGNSKGQVEADSAAKEGRGVKRKFELDEEEMLKNAKQERIRARQALDDEKSAKPTLPSFWVPSLTPSSTKHHVSKPSKLHPLCPASSTSTPHPLYLKSLISVRFSTTNSSSGKPSNNIDTSTTATDNEAIVTSRISCPACKKALSNALKAMLTIPCGHVICKACAGRFMIPKREPPNPHSTVPEEDVIRCYVCDEDLIDKAANKKDSKKDGKEVVRPGLVELSSEGTGFAGGGKNLAKREGIAFQC